MKRAALLGCLTLAACATFRSSGPPMPAHRVLTLVSITPPLGTALDEHSVLRARLHFEVSPMEADDYLVVALVPTRDGLAWGPRAHVAVDQPAGEVTLEVPIADLLHDPLLATPLRLRFALLAQVSSTLAQPVAQTEPVTLMVSGDRRQRDAGLVLDLPLESDLVDRSPAHQPVEAQGVVGFRDGALELTGDGWLQLPAIAFDGPAFATSIWIAPDDEGATYGLLEQGEGREPRRHLQLMVRKGHPYLGFVDDDLAGARSLPRGEWTHLVFQFRDGEQELWMNGHRIGQRSAGHYQGTGGSTLIGHLPRAGERGHDVRGRLRGLRIYQRALSPREVAALFREGQPAPAPPEAGPLHLLHLHAIRTANDDGSDETIISAGQVMRWVRKTNQVLADAQARIRLEFDGHASELVRDTGINHMSNSDEQAKARANEIALRHPDELVFFFRYAAGRGPKQNRGNGFAGLDTQFIALPAFDQTTVRSNVDDTGARRAREGRAQNIWQMAHDLGHFLGLPHTFGEMARAPRDLAAQMTEWGVLAYDGDEIADTAPDIGPEFFTAQQWSFCGETGSLVAIAADGTFLRYPLANARNNIMSYFACEPMGFTPGQVRVMRRSFERPDRKRLLGREATVSREP